MDLRFDEDFKAKLLRVIEDSLAGRPLSYSDGIMLFHWVRNANEPYYAWVPNKYKKGLANYGGKRHDG